MRKGFKTAMVMAVVIIGGGAVAASGRWDHPALAEYDACLQLVRDGHNGQAEKRMEELRPSIEYLASLDPRD